MRRLGLFEGSILDPGLDDAPGACPPIEQLRHPTHWATYRAASPASARMPTVTAEPSLASPARSVPGFLARRGATGLCQAATGAVMATLAASTLFFWQQRSPTTAASRPAAPIITASLVSAEQPAPTPTPRSPAATPPASAAQDQASAPDAVSTPALAEAAAPTEPAAPTGSQGAIPSSEPETETAAAPIHDEVAALPDATASATRQDVPAALAQPVAGALMMRAMFAPPVLVQAEAGAVRVTARDHHPAPPHFPRRPAPRVETHLAAARSSLPRWLTETHRTPLIMSEQPHDLVAPPDRARPPEAVATPPPPSPTLRAVTRAAAPPAAPRWYGGPVYRPYGYMYGGPYGGYRSPYGYRAPNGYGPYGPPPGPYGAPPPPPEDVTIE